MNREKVLDIAIKQAANPTNWGLNFFQDLRQGLLEPLKHRGPIVTRDGGVSTDRGANSRYGKNPQGSLPPLSISLALSTFELKKRETIIGTGSVKVEGWWGLQLDGERKFCKGGTDGGGGRAKGKTTAKRHSWTPSKTWPCWRVLESPVRNDFIVPSLNSMYLTR